MILIRTAPTSELSWARIVVVSLRKETILYKNIVPNLKNFDPVPQVVLEMCLSPQSKSQFSEDQTTSSVD